MSHLNIMKLYSYKIIMLNISVLKYSTYYKKIQHDNFHDFKNDFDLN